ncbi:sulfate reduction electron transfer complex DsrMKJOP subunit DsrO [Planctomycetota bacterium]
MDSSRREFLKLLGFSALGVAGGSSLPVLAEEAASDKRPALPKGARPPLTAKRWAMVIDIPQFDLHKSWDRCIEACHSVHNVPDFGEDNLKDEIKWIWTEKFEKVFPNQEQKYVAESLHKKDVPVLCNHCDNPPCTRVCPTEATWKRESDGVVMMDWHRCIGCRYCMVACPYGSRSFNWRNPRPFIDKQDPDYPTRMRGVVEKCTFCDERLGRGLMPACVDACEHGEMAFGDLEDPDSEVRSLLSEHFTIRRKVNLGTQPEIYYIV